MTLEWPTAPRIYWHLYQIEPTGGFPSQSCIRVDRFSHLVVMPSSGVLIIPYASPIQYHDHRFPRDTQHNSFLDQQIFLEKREIALSEDIEVCDGTCLGGNETTLDAPIEVKLKLFPVIRNSTMAFSQRSVKLLRSHESRGVRRCASGPGRPKWKVGSHLPYLQSPWLASVSERLF